MNAADLKDPTEYLFANSQASSLEQAASGKVGAIGAMTDVARNSVRDMHRLAGMALTDLADSRLEEIALDIADATHSLPSNALDGVRNMLVTHRREWLAYLDMCGPGSWVARYVEN
jgi:hypothetical protein